MYSFSVLLGLGHVSTGQVDDLAGHGGGEEHGLTLSREHRDDPLDIREEAHVQHLVGLVEHEDPHAAEVEVAPLRQVDQATGRTDDDVDTRLEGVDLRLVGAAAVHGEHADPLDAAGAIDVGGHLEAELAGRADDEGLRDALTRLDALQDGHAEAERLPGAGLGLADDVRSARRDRESLLLDREGVGDAVGGERVRDLRVGTEFGEGRGGGGIYIRSHLNPWSGLRVGSLWRIILTRASRLPRWRPTRNTAPLSSTCSGCWRTASFGVRTARRRRRAGTGHRRQGRDRGDGRPRSTATSWPFGTGWRGSTSIRRRRWGRSAPPWTASTRTPLRATGSRAWSRPTWATASAPTSTRRSRPSSIPNPGAGAGGLRRHGQLGVHRRAGAVGHRG